jgi:integrase
MRPPKKSRERGLFKECGHLWDSCACPWLGRFRAHRRVNLAKWAAVGKRKLPRSEAIDILAEVRGAILKNEFDPSGKFSRPDAKAMTFGEFLDQYERDEVEKRGLSNKALPAFLKAIRAEFGSANFALIACAPKAIEAWMEGMRERDVPMSDRTTKTRRVVWSARTWNAYRTMGIRLFNWARHPKQKFTTENPFLLIDKQKGERHRETRITKEQQERLLEVCEAWMRATHKNSDLPHTKRRRMGREMYRRLLAAFDTGLRAGEMGLVQQKHIDYATWRITIPWENAKGGKTTGRDEFVWAMSDRLRKALEERRFLGAEGYVFGTEDGERVKKFHKAWRTLFAAAGLPPDLIWHDARHEFVSSLIEVGGTIQEVKEAARHKSISTTSRYMKAHEERLKGLLARRAEGSGR